MYIVVQRPNNQNILITRTLWHHRSTWIIALFYKNSCNPDTTERRYIA